MSYVHYGELEQVTDEHHLRYGESNGSTNGSSLTRSRNTVAEENLYTTVSPTAGHPNNMGQYFFFLKDRGIIWFFDNSVFVDEIVKNLFDQLSILPYFCTGSTCSNIVFSGSLMASPESSSSSLSSHS